MSERYLTFKLFESDHRLVHGFTYRDGGKTELPFGSQHMGLLSFHYQNEAWENIKDFTHEVLRDHPPKALIFTEQIHGDVIKRFELEKSQLIEREGHAIEVIEGTDGIFTTERNVLLMTFYADCTPVYFYDSLIGVIGMVHSGWKGTKEQIAVKALRFMESEYHSKIEDIRIVIGPAAGYCCYEVDQVIYDVFKGKEKYFTPNREGHYHMDMRRMIGDELISNGIREENLEISSACTICDEKHFFSHRRDQGFTGRMAAFMMIKE